MMRYQLKFLFGSQIRIREGNAPKNMESTFQMAASWQANKNFLVKVCYALLVAVIEKIRKPLLIADRFHVQGKLGPLSSSIALAFKSWWKPAFTFSISGMSIIDLLELPKTVYWI